MAKPTRKQLKRRILELEAQIASRHALAHSQLQDASREALTGSGALLQITAIGGKEIIPPILIRDGLRQDTIAALQADLRRSYQLAVQSAPETP